MNATRLLTIKSAAERTTLSRRSIQRLVRDGVLPCYRLLGRIRVAEADIEKFLDSHFIPARG